MTSYRVYNCQQEYFIKVDSEGVIVESTSRPCGRVHWVVGDTLEWLKEYYMVGKVLYGETTNMLRYHFEELK